MKKTAPQGSNLPPSFRDATSLFQAFNSGERPAQKKHEGRKTRGDWGGSEKTAVNNCNKGSFRYTGFQYTLLLVDYDTFCQHSITSDVDEECDMAVARHMSSSHADLESIINNAIEHFPHVESLRDEQKICLKNLVEGKDVFAILPTGFGKSLIFQLFPRIMSIVKETVGVFPALFFPSSIFRRRPHFLPAPHHPNAWNRL